MTDEHSKTGITNPFKDDMTGRVLLGRYRIVRRLAAGGMGVVYLARAEGARGFVKPVVVKLILPNFSSDESFLRMFIREAQILSKLDDPGIVSVIDFAQEKDFYIMVLEYVHGFQLREWAKYREKTGKPLPTEVVVQIILKVLRPLHHAHTVKDSEGKELQVVHQDISPSNILLSTDGRVKLVDFGIARVSNSTEGGLITTGTGGAFQGKLSYAAPERFSSHPATVQCDLYSVGVTLHELLVGRNEFSAKDHAGTIARVLNHKVSSVLKKRPDVPAELDNIIAKALSKEPGVRYQTAIEFADALSPLLTKTEREIDEEIADLVGDDFSDEMAEFLGIESLSSREQAWRRPSEPPQEVTKKITANDMADLVGQQSLDSTVSLKPEGHYPENDTYINNLQKQSVKPLAHTPENWEASSATAALPNAAPVKAVVVPVKPILIAIGILFIVVGVAVGIFITRPTKKPEKIVLVQSQVEDETSTAKGDMPLDSSVSTETAENDVQKEIDTSTKISPEKKESNSSKTQVRDGTKVRKALSPQQQKLLKLTNAFKKQKGKIRACFKSHPNEIRNIKQISVLFTVEKSGKTKSVGVLPKSISSGNLGSCITQIAKRTKFPRQDSSLSFTIPVTVSK